MYTLYYYPGNANLAPHIILEELEHEYRLNYVKRDEGEHKESDYLKLNPSGRIPVLVDGEIVLYETAAICLHLVDTHPDCGLIPPLGTAARANVYKWLMYLTNTVQVEFLLYFYPQRWANSESGAEQIKSHAEARINDMLDLIESELSARGPFLAGSDYSLLDPYLFMLGRWSRGLERPARSRPQLKVFLETLLERRAVKDALRAEQISAPYF